MRFLMTTDGSPRSLQVLPHAVRLAEVTGAELLLLRVLDPRLDSAASRAPSLAEAAKEVAAEWLTELEALARELPVRARVTVDIKDRSEDVAEAVLRVAAQRRVRLICLATRGSGAVRRALLGSVATAVLSKTSPPVMVTGEHVRPPRESLPYHALVTSDGSPAAEAVLPPFRRVFEKTPRERLRITLLRVNEEAGADPLREPAFERCKRELAAFKRHAPLRFPIEQVVRNIVPLGGVDTAILNAASEGAADAIWMATHGHSLRRHVLLGSVALGAVSRAEVPVVLEQALR